LKTQNLAVNTRKSREYLGNDRYRKGLPQKYSAAQQLEKGWKNGTT
jgi:hypothetical protein